MIGADRAEVDTTARLAAARRLFENGQFADAADTLRELSRAAPEDPGVWVNLGIALVMAKSPAEALTALERARELAPGDVSVAYHAALARAQMDDRDGALAELTEALKHAPGHFECAFEAGRLLRETGRNERALAVFLKTTRVMADAGRYDEALAALGQARELAPQSPELVALAGDLYTAKADFANAERAYEALLELGGESAEALNSLGLAKFHRGDYAAAKKLYRRALELKPVFPQARNNLANLLAREKNVDEALKHYQYALRQFPGYADAWYNFARELIVAERRGEAQAALERCISLDRKNALAHTLLGSMYLTEGNLVQGWAGLRWRVAANTGLPYIRDPRDAARIVPLPLAEDFRDVAGRRVIVHPESTLGDELFFYRFVPALAARGAEVRIAPSAKLAPLLRECSTLEVFDGAYRDDDRLILAGDLPAVLEVDDYGAVPGALALAVPEPKRALVAEALASLGDGPVLALTWRAGKAADAPYRKELAIGEAAAIAREWHGPVIALQRGLAPGELEALAAAAGREVVDYGMYDDDLVMLAAVLSVVDEYVGVSNTNMHIRGCLGKPFRVLVKRPGEWRWAREGGTTPWYPKARLYRESRRTGWGPALADVRAALGATTGTERPDRRPDSP